MNPTKNKTRQSGRKAEQLKTKEHQENLKIYVICPSTPNSKVFYQIRVRI